MNSSWIIDLLNEIEFSFPVSDWRAAGIRIWPFLRTTLGYKLCFVNENAPERTDVQSRFKLAAQQVLALARGTARYFHAQQVDRRHNAEPLGKVDAAFLSDGVSYSNVGGVWYERFCDPLISCLEKQRLRSFLLCPLHSYFVPRRSPSKFIQPHLDLLTLKAFAASRFEAEIKQELRGYEECRQLMVRKGSPVNLPAPSTVGSQALRIRYLADFYKHILTRVQPSVGFCVSYYWSGGMAFSLACRELEIPSVDLQHGVQGELHFAYGRWCRLPEAGYELLPTVFWCWTQSEERAIRAWSRRFEKWHRPFVGGNPWLAQWSDGKHGFAAEYDQGIRSLMEPGRRQILVTLQPARTKPLTLQPLLEAVGRSPEEWQWWIRLHPCMEQERDKIRSAFASRTGRECRVDGATDVPLCALLRHMDVHVTHSSSAVLEAEAFGVPSVVISTYGAELFPDQVSSGWAQVGLQSEEIGEAIHCQLQRHNRYERSRLTINGFDFKAMLAAVRGSLSDRYDFARSGA